MQDYGVANLVGLTQPTGNPLIYSSISVLLCLILRCQRYGNLHGEGRKCSITLKQKTSSGSSGRQAQCKATFQDVLVAEPASRPKILPT